MFIKPVEGSSVYVDIPLSRSGTNEMLTNRYWTRLGESMVTCVNKYFVFLQNGKDFGKCSCTIFGLTHVLSNNNSDIVRIDVPRIITLHE